MILLQSLLDWLEDLGAILKAAAKILAISSPHAMQSPDQALLPDAALNSEQKALLDFLVLAKGKAFVGLGSSTFSFFLREYRVLAGLPRSTSVIVDTSRIGTDPLFHSAGTVI